MLTDQDPFIRDVTGPQELHCVLTLNWQFDIIEKKKFVPVHVNFVYFLQILHLTWGGSI